MPLYIDQLKREVSVVATPRRIVSLVPSQTELLYALGLRSEVVGITKFCVHPEEWFRSKTRVGGTKTVKTGIVQSLQPDLILANKEENVKEQVHAMERIAPVWISDVDSIAGALEMIHHIGDITGKQTEALAIVQQATQSLHGLQLQMRQQKKYRTAYLIWKDPYMAAGGDTYISDVMRAGGFENVFADMKRYPSVTPELLRSINTELVLLSSEPYPFQQKHLGELQSQLPGVRILLVDGEIFSWYGSRVGKIAGYLETMRQKLPA